MFTRYELHGEEFKWVHILCSETISLLIVGANIYIYFFSFLGVNRYRVGSVRYMYWSGFENRTTRLTR